MLLTLNLICVMQSFITAYPKHGNKLPQSEVFFQSCPSTNICQNTNSSFNVNCFCGNFTSFLKTFSHMILKYQFKKSYHRQIKCIQRPSETFETGISLSQNIYFWQCNIFEYVPNSKKISNRRYN